MTIAQPELIRFAKPSFTSCSTTQRQPSSRWRSPHGCAGILVTRHDPSRHTVPLSEAVPFGETREQVSS
jgi:hypothetical protein